MQNKKTVGRNLQLEMTEKLRLVIVSFNEASARKGFREYQSDQRHVFGRSAGGVLQIYLSKQLEVFAKDLN